ncbi:MAG: choice-of-anchor B family protein [Steroidobacteraceae bacterium]|nr:choice-of-anchor B family protein [Steroidobacteraceae bacterium]
MQTPQGRARRFLDQFPALAATVATALAAGVATAHDDVAGTRYVAPEGVDSDDCDHRDAPCRTLEYAFSQLRPGDAVKVGAGTYDLSGFNLEELLFGKQGLRAGYSAADDFATDDPVAHRAYVRGADPRFVQTLIAFGFTPVDEAGVPIPREKVQAQAATPCSGGLAGTFPCWNIDFLAQIPLTSFSTQPLSVANLWGFVDRDDNREYVIVGLRNGTAVVDVTTPESPREVATIPGVTNAWREVKVYQVFDAAANRHRAYAYITTEGAGAGLQIIDLSDLPATATLANTLHDLSTSHTLYLANVDYATGMALPGATPFLYVAGADLLGGRYRIYSLADPVNPTLVATNPGAPGAPTPYMHDSTSVLLTDNRTTQCAAAHNPCEVLIDFNVERVDLWDVTDKAAPAFLGSATYPNARYIHSGWPTTDQRYVIVHDELDELRIPGLHTSIYTLDIGDLRAPTITTSFTGADTTTDHNGYTVGDRYYLAHYRRGLVIHDLADPRALREVGWFDTFLLPVANVAGTDGAWGVYPFLPSGTLAVSDISNGLFLLKRNETSATPPATPAPSPPGLGGGGGGGTLGGATGGALLALLAWLATRRAWLAVQPAACCRRRRGTSTGGRIREIGPPVDVAGMNRAN